MPLSEITEQVIGGALEFLGETIIRWPGQQCCRIFRRDVGLDSPWAFWAGLLLWLALCCGAWMLYAHI